MKKIVLLFFFSCLSITVLAQTSYEIQVKNLRFGLSSGIQRPTTSNVTLQIIYEDNSSQQIYYKSIQTQADVEPGWTLNPPIISNKQPKTIRTVGFVNFSSGTDAKYDNYSPINLCAQTNYVIGTISPRMTDITFQIEVKPIASIQSMNLDNTNNSLLPSNDKIAIKTQNGFPTSIYNWEYATDGTNWTDLPLNLSSQGQSSVYISLDDIYGSSLNNYIGANTYFRLRTCNNIYSNVITLNNVISSPHLSSVTPIQNTCFGLENGGFKLQLDRNLLPNELLNVIVSDVVSGDVVMNINNVSSLEPGYILTSPSTLPPGQYKIELIGKFNGVTSYTGSSSHTATTSFTGPTAVDFNIAKRDIYCYDGKDGTITINASGGSGGYRVLYKKLGENEYTENTFSATAQHTISGLDTGTYAVRVLDQNGCYKKDSNGNEAVATIILTQPQEPLTIDYKQNINPTAFGTADGKVQAIIVGGTANAGNYNVQWTDLNGNVLSSFTNTTNPFKTVLNNVGDGKYILKVSDSNFMLAQLNNAKSCLVTDTFTLVQPKLLKVAIATMQQINCNGYSNGELYAKAEGGVEIPGEKYKYQWFKDVSGTFTALTQTDSLLTAVAVGTYKVKVTDQNNISVESAPFTLTEPTPLSFTTAKRDIYCYNGKDGVITINVIGANGAYKLLYKKQNEASYTTIDFATAEQHQLTNLDIGTYTIRVMDSKGCYQKDINGAEVIQTVTITQPTAALQIDTRTVVNPTAFGSSDGYAEVNISGGTPNTGIYNVQWTDINGTVLTNFTNSTNPFRTKLSNVPDGKYILRVTDSNYAFAQTSNASRCVVIDTIVLKQPEPLKIDIEELRYVACKGDSNGQLYAKAMGGIIIPQQKYKYQWFKEMNGTFTVMAQTDSVLVNVNSGVYKVKITDFNNISKESIPFNLIEPEALAIVVSSTPLSCSGDTNGSANVRITGGTPPYQIEWSNGAQTAAINNLTDGNYLVFVSDAHGCQVQSQVNVIAPNPLQITNSSAKNPTCLGNNDGAISHSITGGIPPYQFVWSNGATTQNLSNLTAGSYTLTVSESNGCGKTITYNLIDPAAVVVNLGPDVKLCTDQVHQVDATIPNGAIYKWISNNGFTANTAKVTLSTAGIYYVEAITDKGCIGRDTIEIKKSTAVIAAEFVVSTQAFKGETVNLVNISNPKPQSVEWIIPVNNNIKVVSKSNEDLQLSFAATGTYTISLKATVGDCFKIFTKQITVIEGTSFNDPGTVKDPFIKSFQVAPNPASGTFYVKVELQDIAKIKLRLLNTITGQLINSREENGSSSYNLPYNLNLSTGVYVLVLETPKENRIHKVLIQ